MTGGRGAKPILSQTTESNVSKSVNNSAANSINNYTDSDIELETEIENSSSKGVDLNPAAWRQMEKLISKQVSITVEKQSIQINDRIDTLSSRIEGIRDGYEGQIKEIK